MSFKEYYNLGLSMAKMMLKTEAKEGASLVEAVVGVIIGIILIAQVAIPTTTDAVANLTGTEATIMGKVPLMLAIVGLVLVVGLVGARS